jgi:hypothetical protein
MSQAITHKESSSNEVFRHKSLVIDQCDTSELFTMTLGEEKISFRLCDLLSFKKKIFSIDLVQLFDVSYRDVEIIYLPNLDRHLLLSLEDLLSVRELLTGTFAILQLNSQVQRFLHNPFAGNIPH